MVINYIKELEEENRLLKAKLKNAQEEIYKLKQKHTTLKVRTIVAINKLTNEETEYPSVLEASRRTGNCYASIASCLRGEKKSTKDFFWKYREE